MSTLSPARTPQAAHRASASVTAPTTVQSIWLVAEREIASKLRSKPFMIATIILVVVALAGVIWGGFQSGTTTERPVAVTSDAQQFVAGVPGFEITEAADRAAAEELVLAGDVDAAIVGDSATPTGVTIIGDSDMSNTLVMMLSVTPTVELLNPSSTDAGLRYIVAIGFGVVFLFAASMFGGTIAQSVVEEKSTRVIKLLLTAVPPRALLAGKVIGNTVLAMGQILLLAAVSVIGLSITGQSELLQGLGAPLAWFAVFFLFGFILLASMFAAAAAMVSRQEDIGSTTTPITFLIMIPYMMVIFFNDNPTVMAVMSYVPFSAPVGMPMRLFLGEAQWWEPLLSLVILLATCVVAILIGAKIYENSLLKMGARVKLSEALKG